MDPLLLVYLSGAAVMACCVTVVGSIARWEGLDRIAARIGIVIAISAIWPLVVGALVVGGLLWLIWPQDSQPSD